MTARVEVDGRGVATVTLARPGKHNAMDAATMDALSQAAERLGRDPAVRVVVLGSEGATFCAGGDLGWMREQMEADGEAREREARRLAGMLALWDALPKPVVARVQGNAFGGGVGLLAVCDVAVGVEGAAFAMTETRLGLIPATIGPYVLARIGEPAARRLMLGARRIGAVEAREMGLLARVVAAGGLDRAVEEEVGALLGCAPGAVAEAKALIRALRPPAPGAVDRSVAALVARWETEEAREGVRAFFDRREPPWRG